MGRFFFSIENFVPSREKTLRGDAQFAEKNLIALQYRERARVSQSKLFLVWESSFYRAGLQV